MLVNTHKKAIKVLTETVERLERKIVELQKKVGTLDDERKARFRYPKIG